MTNGVCPLNTCDGSGWIFEIGAKEARPCDCRQHKINAAQQRRIGSTIPRRYRGVSFDRPPVPSMDPDRVDIVRRFCAVIDEKLEAGEGLWLAGPAGTGKTTLAMLVAKTALEAGHLVAVYSTPGLLAEIRRTFDEENHGPTYQQLTTKLVNADLLYLDDLGAEKQTDWVLEQFYYLVNRRYEEMRSVIVTTNLQRQLLADQVGGRVVSRLSEMCGEPIVFGGRDHRLREVA